MNDSSFLFYTFACFIIIYTERNMNEFSIWQDEVVHTRVNSLINARMILRILGVLLFIEGGLLMLCAAVSLGYAEPDYIYFIYATLAAAGLGGILVFLGRHAEKRMGRRDGYCIVAFTWLLFTIFGMLPFYLSGHIPTLADAFFETMSGFTTTGATILDHIESLPHGMLFWRSFSQWIGGLGIVFFTIAVLPVFGVGNQVLFSAEATGVTHDKIHPKISIMAKWIWTVYLILTVAETVLLMLGGMSFFDALCHSFSTTATGGYSTKQASVAYWNSPFIEYVIAVFMILSGINFTLFFLCLKGKFSQLLTDDEVKFFLGSVTTVTLIITLALFFNNHYALEPAFRKALFQVATAHTSCGFVTDDYNLWPGFTWMLLIYAMLAGGCTGSTGGGIKNMRLVLVLRSIRNEFSRMIHPRAVFSVKFNRQAVPASVVSTVSLFILTYLVCIFAGWVLLMCMGVGLPESLALTVSSLGNVGPGLGAFGPEYSWSALPALAKWLLSFLMLIGRLELFGILLMFMPGFWRSR